MSTAMRVNQNIRGYEPGEIPVRGCTTAQIVAAGLGVPLQAFIDGQYLDSTVMSRRPGMHLKYLPYLYDGVSGKLLTGGSYLFDTYEDAKDYMRWATQEFEVSVSSSSSSSKVKFTEQPMFDSFTGRAWKVVGAHSFVPIHQHAIGRLQWWDCTSNGAEETLLALYPELRSAAGAGGSAASIWLLYDPDTNAVGLQLGFIREGEASTDEARRGLAAAEKQNACGDLLRSRLKLTSLFDRTSVLLTLWLPKSRAAGGAELAIPYYPMVPEITHPYV